jgi:hypothetical protein
MHARPTSLLRLATLLATATLLAGNALSAADAPASHWKDDPTAGTADLLYGDQPVLRYMSAYDTSTPERATETSKVFHHVFGPGTGQIITNGAGGLYPHHRGLFVGWNKTSADGDKWDFWHCKDGVQHQRHVKFLEQSGNADSGTMTAEIHWNDADGKPVITETRTVKVSIAPTDNASKPGWQIDWSTSLASNRGTITLDGDRQHAGFQFRAASPVAEANSARYIRPAGFPTKPEAFEVEDRNDPNGHINLGWLAMTYPLEGVPYTVEYFEAPSLPKPSRFSERPYGRFGAFFKTTIEPDHPLQMKYRLRVTSGPAPSQEQIQARYEAFVAELKENP